MLKPRPSIPIGGERALVQLDGGEYVCVDLRSLDSLAYLLGWDLESDVVEVFRTFLKPGSAVVDVGASCGLYTAIAAAAVRRDGRVFALEGNPEVFPCLERTIIANGHFGNPNIVAANRLVSDRCGSGTLNFTPEAFHLGTMADVSLPGGERRSIEVAMTTLDAVLPADIPIDLVKIDVEGHEPSVLRGMERTIARSPNLRVIIEFADYMLARTLPAGEFAAYIRRLGFAICRIEPGGGLRTIGTDETIAGFNNLLLTRTPQPDKAAVERRRAAGRPPAWRRWRSRFAGRRGWFRL